MPKEELSPDDPYEVVAQGFSATPQEFDYMTNCILEEFALLGYTEEMIIAMFRSPYYQLPHSIYKSKGEDYVVGKFREIRERWFGGLPAATPACPNDVGTADSYAAQTGRSAEGKRNS